MIIVADNLRITNRGIEQAMKDTDPKPVRQLAERCALAGAEAIDINTGPLNKAPEKKMEFMVGAVQEVLDLPILIDTANPRAIEAGLRVSRRKAIINGFSLEPEKLKSILPLANKYEADIIGYLLYPDGNVPPNGAERLNVAVDLFAECRGAGVDEAHLIIDPIIVPLMWQNGNIQDMEILSVIRTLPDLLGYNVRTIAGLSNLTAGRKNKDEKALLERAYLPMLLEAGLSMALIDVFHEETIRIARACRTLISPRVFSFEEIPDHKDNGT